MIVRVGAPEYEPAEQIKNFTLRAQCEDIVRQDLIEKLKRQLNFIRELRELTQNGLLEYEEPDSDEESFRLVPEQQCILEAAMGNKTVEVDYFLDKDHWAQLEKIDKDEYHLKLDIV